MNKTEAHKPFRERMDVRVAALVLVLGSIVTGDYAARQQAEHRREQQKVQESNRIKGIQAEVVIDNISGFIQSP